MSSAHRFITHYTVDDYRHWEGDWELIDGIAVSMTPSPFAPHERIVSRLSRMIGVQIEQNRCPCEVYANLDWIVSDDTVIRPDLMVVCGDQPEKHLQRPPELMVEVLSESTRDRDLSTKRAIARENGVAHYLIIDPDQRTLLHVTSDDEVSVESDGTHTLTLGTDDCSVQIECKRLFD